MHNLPKLILSLALLSCQIPAASAATHNTKSISYTDIGQGQPLVLIHAFPTDQTIWLPQQEELSHYFRVITLDLWGFGQAEATDSQAVTMTNYADEVKQLLDQLHIKKAIIAGESMGGYIALAFLQHYPDNVSGLVLSDTQVIADSPETKAKREQTAVAVLKQGTAQLIDSFMLKALTPMAPVQKRNFLHAMLATQTRSAIASALRGMALREDTSTVLANTSLPILILTGDQDTLILPQQSEQMHKLAKNSQLITLSNAAHLSSLEQSEQWDHAVIALFYLDILLAVNDEDSYRVTHLLTDM